MALGSLGAAPMKDAGSHDVRKTVTALFCDLAGSTSMGERFDSETMRQIMARY
jgi:class 3 adenylate cyclase